MWEVLLAMVVAFALGRFIDNNTAYIKLKKEWRKWMNIPTYKAHGKALIISNLHYHGMKTRLIVPYDSTEAIRALNFSVHAEIGEETFNVTQFPGVPYLLSVEDLGVDKIVVEDDDGNTIEYTGDKIPKLGEKPKEEDIERFIPPGMAKSLNAIEKMFGPIQVTQTAPILETTAIN